MKNLVLFLSLFVSSLLVGQTTVLTQNVNDGGYSIEYRFVVVDGLCKTIYVEYTKNGLVSQRYGYHPENLVLVTGSQDLVILKDKYRQISLYFVEGIPFNDNGKEVLVYNWTKIE